MKIDVNGGLIKAENLLEIGHINAICGRNNSGKSTLLRAIVDGKVDVAEYLRNLRHIDVQDLATKHISSGNLTNVWGAARAISIAVEAASEQGVTVGVGSTVQVRRVLGEAVKDYASQISFSMDPILNKLREDLRDIPSDRKIVPAKRTIHDGVRAASRDKIANLNGEGVLEHLFTLQTHRTDLIGMETLRRLEEAFAQVTDGYRFEIDFSEDKLFLYFRQRDGDLIPAGECGLGLQDTLIILYACVVDDADWLLIEEPENHLHPQIQRELLRFFAGVEGKNFFLATHSNVLLDQTYVDGVYQCAYEDGVIHVSDATSKAALLSNLGYSATDNLVADVILGVEGKHDKEAIEEIASKIKRRSEKIVRVWLLGGDVMDQQDFDAIHAAFDVRVLIDQEKDKGSQRAREKVKAECARLGIPCTVLSRYAMENYYSPEAYHKVFPALLDSPPAIPYAEKVEKVIGFNPKGQTRSLARETPLEHLEGTELLKFVQEAYA